MGYFLSIGGFTYHQKLIEKMSDDKIRELIATVQQEDNSMVGEHVWPPPSSIAYCLNVE